MTTEVNTLRQSVLYAERSFTYDDFTSGEAKPVIYLKPNTRILRGFLDITTAFNSGSSDSMTVGDTEGVDDVDRYLGATDVSSTGLTALTAPPIADGVIGTPEAVTITWTGGGDAPTAGAGTIAIEYIEVGRQTEIHPYRG
jgi:hypothetical protein